MLKGDSAASALAASQAYPLLPNMIHFHDPDRIVGARIAESIGAPGRTAWDFYLIYEIGQHWKDVPPTPLGWFHQLRDESWADQSKLRWGEDLGPAIRSLLDRKLGFRAD